MVGCWVSTVPQLVQHLCWLEQIKTKTTPNKVSYGAKTQPALLLIHLMLLRSRDCKLQNWKYFCNYVHFDFSWIFMRVQATEDPRYQNFVKLQTRDPHGIDAYSQSGIDHCLLQLIHIRSYPCVDLFTSSYVCWRSPDDVFEFFTLVQAFVVIVFQNGEQQRGGAASLQARQVSASPARQLRPVPQVRLLRKVVCQHRQRQPSQRLAHALWCQHIPGESAFIRG